MTGYENTAFSSQNSIYTLDAKVLGHAYVPQLNNGALFLIDERDEAISASTAQLA